MDAVKGTVEATIQLTKANCYYMNHGVCSLSLVDNYFISHEERLSQNDLFYCPRVYAQLKNRATDRPVSAVPCDCGHVQILNYPQRACVAERKGLMLSLKVDDNKEERATCSVCSGQTSLHPNDATGNRILSLTVRATKTNG